MPGLDGLRALAVIAVLLYHAGLPWIPGGFLGVEVFFVISGFLITALLLSEWRARGRIDLKAFWLRRARRLLPALYLLLVVTLAYAVIFLPEEVARLRSDALAAFAYVTNWYLVLGHESYFEAVGRPSLLKHLWSLAVEEQFYLLWPLLFAAAVSVGAMRFRQRRVLALALGGASLSAILMAVLYVPGVDPSRLYFGTDTRATGLLIGAALAVAWTPKMRTGCSKGRALHRARGRLWRKWGWTTPLWLDVVGFAALGALVFFCLRLGEFQPFLYRGGLALVALATAALILALANPYTRLGNVVLGWRPLRWIGERSYGIYLWHWPVFMVTRPQLDVPIEGLQLLALRLVATVVLADLSYRYVETPFRTGAVGHAWRSLREARGFRRWDLGVRWVGAVVPVVAVSVVLGVAVAQARSPDPPSYITTKAIHTAQDVPAKDGAEQRSSRPEPRREPATDPSAREPASKNEKAASTDAAAIEPAPSGPVSAIGDSVMLGSAVQLEKDLKKLAVMDAQVGMQVYTAIDILRSRRDAGQLGEVVVVHLGSNGTFTAEQFDEMMQVLSGVRKVIFVNVKVPRAWEGPNNEVLAEGVRRYPEKAVLVDWFSASVNHPEYFAEDGIHLQPKGQRVYADLIARQIN